jgi:hypothetical protein
MAHREVTLKEKPLSDIGVSVTYAKDWIEIARKLSGDSYSIVMMDRAYVECLIRLLQEALEGQEALQ